jgi:hypothetical protein
MDNTLRIWLQSPFPDRRGEGHRHIPAAVDGDTEFGSPMTAIGNPDILDVLSYRSSQFRTVGIEDDPREKKSDHGVVHRQ